MNPFESPKHEGGPEHKALFISVANDWLYLGDATPAGNHLSCRVERAPDELLPTLRAAFIGGYPIRILHGGKHLQTRVDIIRDEHGGWEFAFV